MLERLFYAGVGLVLVGVIAGQSYQYGGVRGELAALRAQRVSPPPIAPPRQPEPLISTRETLPAAPPVEAPAKRIARSNATALARLYAPQAAAQPRRAQQAAATLARLAQQSAPASSFFPPVQLEIPAPDYGTSRRTRDPWPDSYAQAPKRTVVEHVVTVYANPCPRGQKLIAATCLPADSIILGQAPIPVRIVNPIPRDFDVSIFESPRRTRIRHRREWDDAPAREQPAPEPWTYGSSGLLVPQFGSPPAGLPRHVPQGFVFESGGRR